METLEPPLPPSPAVDHQSPPSPATDHQSPPSPATDHQSPPSPATDHQSPPSPATDHRSAPSPATDHQSPPSPADDRSEQKRKISFPTEIIEDILSRLPVRSILQFRSVDKQWRSIISTPSFTNQHFNRSGHRTAFFLSAYHRSARKRYFLTAAHGGGSVTHLATLDNVPPSTADTAESEHINGLVCFSSANGSLCSNHAFVINPSTRKIVKVPDSASWTNYLDGEWNTCYLFGFDESRNEHKILNIRIRNYATTAFEILLFSVSNYSWRKIDSKLPVECYRDRLHCIVKCSVCVGSVIHFMIRNSFEIITFDLRTEEFSQIEAPDGVVLHEFVSTRIVKIDGRVGIVCHDFESNEIDIWMLQDYESCVWVRESIAIPEAWIALDGYFSLDSVNMDDIIFFSTRVSRFAINVHMYNMKDRSFKAVQFTLSQPFLCLNEVVVDQIKSYAESIVPVKRTE